MVVQSCYTCIWYTKLPFYVGAQTFPGARYGAGSGRIHLSSLRCTGSEARLADCPRGTTDGCTHQDDAGLMCNTSMMLTIHLLFYIQVQDVVNL